MRDSPPRAGGSAEGGPGNEYGSRGCARGSYRVSERKAGADSAPGSTGCRQGNTGEGAGGQVGGSADFDRRPAALQPGSRDAAGAEGERDHGGGQAGAGRSGERVGTIFQEA